MPRLGDLTLVGGGVATNPIHEIHPATEENTMFAAIRYRLARARIAEVYHQAQRHAGHRATR